MGTKKCLLVLGVLMCVFGLTAWAAGPVKKVINVGISEASKEVVFYQEAEDELMNAAKDWEKKTGRTMNFTVTVAGGDVARQASDIEDLISKKMDIILMVPQDSKAIVASIKEAHNAGIKVMTFLRAASPTADAKADAHVGLDTTYQAYVAGKALIEKMKKDNVSPQIIHVIGDLRDENAVNREKGFEQAVKDFGGKILVTVPSEWNNDKALAGLSAALQTYPQANALFVASDALLPAVQSACERVDRWYPYGNPKHMYQANLDVQPNGIPLIEKGYIDVDTLWDHYVQGKAAVDAIVKLVDGNRLANREIYVKSRVTTPENIDTLPHVTSRNYMNEAFGKAAERPQCSPLAP